MGFALGWIPTNVRWQMYEEENPAIRMKLPLEERPSWLAYDYLGDAAQIKIKFDRNYLNAFRERYEKLQFEAYVNGRIAISDTMDLATLSPGVPHVYRIGAAPAPEYLPVKIWGIRKNGAKEEVFAAPRPPRGHSNGF